MMRTIILPATTRVAVLSRLQGHYDRVYYQSFRGKLKCVSLASSQGASKPVSESASSTNTVPK